MSLQTSKNAEVRRFVWGSIASSAILAGFMLWVRLDPVSLRTLAVEDGPVESLGAALFGLSSIGFLVAMKRSTFLRQRKERWRYVMMLGWALLMFVFFGEEISWGQRIFGIETPDQLRAVNLQKELNVHNVSSVERLYGGAYRVLTVMIFTIGVLLPLLSLAGPVRRLMQKFAFPVVPYGYVMFFVGSYLFGKYYYSALELTASEVRELLFAMGMFAFSWHGALEPWILFRLPKPEEAALSPIVAGKG